MTSGLLAAVAVALAALIWLTNRRMGVVLRSFEDREAPESGKCDARWELFIKFEDRVETTFKEHLLAMAEGIERVERSERRVRQTIASAKKRFESEGYVDPGLEAEASALPEGNGVTGPEERLPLLHEGLEQDPWRSVPGMSEDEA